VSATVLKAKEIEFSKEMGDVLSIVCNIWHKREPHFEKFFEALRLESDDIPHIQPCYTFLNPFWNQGISKLHAARGLGSGKSL
jgi:hypothetical protein